MIGQTASQRCRGCRRWLAGPVDCEWMFAPTATPSAPSATAKATCRAAGPDEFFSRMRSAVLGQILDHLVVAFFGRAAQSGFAAGVDMRPRPRRL